jgi:hypothetical protein
MPAVLAAGPGARPGCNGRASSDLLVGRGGRNSAAGMARTGAAGGNACRAPFNQIPIIPESDNTDGTV